MSAHEFEFVDALPAKEIRRTNGFLMDEFAVALRQRPGAWAKWPEDLGTSQAGTYTTNIRNGHLKAFRGGGFEALSRNGVLYVRYIGEVPDGA